MASVRRDAKGRVLLKGESVRADGKYQYKYTISGKIKFLYSWRLLSTDPQPIDKNNCLALRELEQTVKRNMDLGSMASETTVLELVERYLKTRTGVSPNTLTNYNFVVNLLKKEEFSSRKIVEVKTSDAKLFLISLQQKGKGSSSIKTVRGVLRPAFQMAVDDDLLNKNPFGFELAKVIYDTGIKREAVSKNDMDRFLHFVQHDKCYSKYYEVFYILFHTGLRISEFCGLTLKDIDFENRIIDVNHQLQRTSHCEYVVRKTKTNAGTRKLPMTDDVCEMFKAIIERRPNTVQEKMVDGYVGFLFIDANGMPEVGMHWDNRMKHAVARYNELFKLQLPKITPHVCRHTYCSNLAKLNINPKTLQYLMGHSEISVTMDVYTHLGFDSAKEEMLRIKELENARKELNPKFSVV